MRLSLIAAIVLAAVGSATAPARAAEDITVRALFYFGEMPTGGVCDQTTDAHCEWEYDYQLVNGVETAEYVLPIPAQFVQAPADGATIDVERNKITITNDISFPFCSTDSVGSACSDVFTGFEFIFSIDITPSLVKVDSASSPDFLPNDTGSHDGLSLIAPNVLLVDLTGDAPAIGDKLVIDIPEPSTWAMMALGFAGLGFAAYRRAGVVRAA